MVALKFPRIIGNNRLRIGSYSFALKSKDDIFRGPESSTI